MAEKKMNPYVKAAIWVGALTAIGVTAVVIQRQWQRMKDRKNNPNPEDTQASKGLTDILFGNTPSSCRYCERRAGLPLKFGSKGKEVAAVQYAYNLRYPSSKILVDGDWGTKTESAVRKLKALFPQVNFSNVAGKGTTETAIIVGPNTYRDYFKQYETI